MENSMLPFPTHFMTAKRWAAELLRIYRYERLPILLEEDKWQEWGAHVAGVGVFKENGIPSPTTVKGSGKVDNFKNWQEWAKAVYIIMIK